VLGRAGLRDGQPPIGWNNAPALGVWCLGSIAVVYTGLFVGPILSGLPLAAKVVLAIAAIAAAALLPRMIGGKTVGGDKLTAAEWKRIAAICVVTVFSVFFWMGFEQAGGSMNLFADQQTQRTLWGFEVPASWFQSINSAAILVLGPLFAIMWSSMNRSRYPLPDSAKQAIGLIVLGLSFVVMDRAKVLADATGAVSPMWLFYAYLIQTVGELMLSPVGLALTSRAAPARVAALLMGVWMLSNAAGNYLAGTLGKIMAGTGIAPYTFLYMAAIGAGVLLLLLTPILHKMLRSRDESTVI
jgi:POT family proton-dependent oligopeptide transporter